MVLVVVFERVVDEGVLVLEALQVCLDDTFAPVVQRVRVREVCAWEGAKQCAQATTSGKESVTLTVRGRRDRQAIKAPGVALLCGREDGLLTAVRLEQVAAKLIRVGTTRAYVRFPFAVCVVIFLFHHLGCQATKTTPIRNLCPWSRVRVLTGLYSVSRFRSPL